MDTTKGKSFQPAFSLPLSLGVPLSLHRCHRDIRQSDTSNSTTLIPRKRLLQYRRSPHPHIQHVAPLDLRPQRPHLIGRDGISAHHHRSIPPNDARVHIAPTPQIVPHPRQHRPLDQLQRLLLLQIVLIPALRRLERRHGRQTPRPHRRVRQLPRRPMRINLIQMRSVHVAPPQHQRGAHVPLIPEQHPLEQRARRDHPALRVARVHAEQLHLTGDELRGLLGVGGGAGPAAVDVGGDVVDFEAVLVGDGGVVGGARVGAEDDAVGVDEADDGGAGFGGEGDDGG
mmetsp:Transcript_1710/g.3257  ORF Transcript_1710/g.3257 Transcript_1710/m.3257 type:complete len:285 (+) Transcript_1710:352-1206(+)